MPYVGEVKIYLLLTIKWRKTEGSCWPQRDMEPQKAGSILQMMESFRGEEREAKGN